MLLAIKSARGRYHTSHFVLDRRVIKRVEMWSDSLDTEHGYP